MGKGYNLTTEAIRTMGKTKMTKQERETLIAEIIDSDYDCIINHYETTYLFEILKDGFKGYNNMTDEELKQERVIRSIEK